VNTEEEEEENGSREENGEKTEDEDLEDYEPFTIASSPSVEVIIDTGGL